MKKNSEYFKYEGEASQSWTASAGLPAVVLIMFLFLSVFGVLSYRNSILTAEGYSGNGLNQQPETNRQNSSTDNSVNGTGDGADNLGNPLTLKDAQAQLQDTDTKLKKALAKLSEAETITVDITTARSRIAAELIDRFSSMKIPVDIDKHTGSVRFSNALLFDINKETIKQEGKDYLKKFMPVYLSVLFSNKNIKYIDQIIIEGHADDGGSYQYNLGLSQNRAYSVADYIFSQNLVKLSGQGASVSSDISKYFTICGRSYSQPITVNGTIDRKLSRRVEFKFRLKDELLDNLSGVFKLTQKSN